VKQKYNNYEDFFYLVNDRLLWCGEWSAVFNARVTKKFYFHVPSFCDLCCIPLVAQKDYKELENSFKKIT